MLKKNKKGMAMLSVLFALVIIGLIFYFANKKPADTSTKSFLNEAGVDTSTYKGTLDSTKKIIKTAEDSRIQTP